MDSKHCIASGLCGRAACGVEGLREIAGLDRAQEESLRPVIARYPFRVTHYYASLAQWQDPDDPIRLQCMPDVRELLDEPALACDPFDEQRHMPVPGVIHRFADRALVVACSECAVACRHCTRKNTLPSLRPGDLSAVLRYIASKPAIREVLVSGGDPLLLGDDALDRLLSGLRSVKHVEVLRVGTRVPVVGPRRVTAELAELLRRHRPLWVNTHFNHPRELTPSALQACDRLVSRGIPVSNQTVLLRGVNDRVETLADLCNGLQRNHVRPYYAFLADPVAGTAHLRVDVSKAAHLARSLRKRVGGLSLPSFVADVPGAASKVPVAELCVTKSSPDGDTAC